MRNWVLAALAVAPIAALAQPPQAGAPPQAGGPPQAGSPSPADAGTGAQQVVGLFGATCLHFGADAQALRQFMQQQGARPLPADAAKAFLVGRPGQAYDASYAQYRLALISLDTGGCEAVIDNTGGSDVVATFLQEAKDNGLPLKSLGSGPGRAPQQTVNRYEATVGAKQMHIYIATAPNPPQASLALAP
jgi:hypothetical protein